MTDLVRIYLLSAALGAGIGGLILALGFAIHFILELRRKP